MQSFASFNKEERSAIKNWLVVSNATEKTEIKENCSQTKTQQQKKRGKDNEL